MIFGTMCAGSMILHSTGRKHCWSGHFQGKRMNRSFNFCLGGLGIRETMPQSLISMSHLWLMKELSVQYKIKSEQLWLFYNEKKQASSYSGCTLVGRQYIVRTCRLSVRGAPRCDIRNVARGVAHLLRNVCVWLRVVQPPASSVRPPTSRAPRGRRAPSSSSAYCY